MLTLASASCHVRSKASENADSIITSLRS